MTSFALAISGFSYLSTFYVLEADAEVKSESVYKYGDELMATAVP